MHTGHGGDAPAAAFRNTETVEPGRVQTNNAQRTDACLNVLNEPRRLAGDWYGGGNRADHRSNWQLMDEAAQRFRSLEEQPAPANPDNICAHCRSGTVAIMRTGEVIGALVLPDIVQRGANFCSTPVMLILPLSQSTKVLTTRLAMITVKPTDAGLLRH